MITIQRWSIPILRERGKVAITKSESNFGSVSVLTINWSEHPGIENERNIV